jgi:DNA-binding response OmpR family regulator
MSARPKLLLIDDDRELTQMLGEFLEGEGFTVNAARTGAEGLRDITAASPDLVVLDVMLPGGSGFDVLRSLRSANARLPVLMLTARGDDVDRILGLELGADDYLAKPFNPRELAARIRAILRRVASTNGERGDEEVLHIGPITVDVARFRVTVGERAVNVTGAELRVLEMLTRDAGRVVSRETLTERALGRPLELYDRSIDTHVSNLRRKLALPAGGVEIRGIRGAGYVLAKGDVAEARATPVANPPEKH